MSLEEAITECVHDMLVEAKRKGVLGDTTMRQVKDHMKEEMGEITFDIVKEEHVDHLKAEVTRIHQELSADCPPNSAESRRSSKAKKSRASAGTYDGGSSGNDESDDFVSAPGKRGRGRNDTGGHGGAAKFARLRAQSTDSDESESDDDFVDSGGKKKGRMKADENEMPSNAGSRSEKKMKKEERKKKKRTDSCKPDDAKGKGKHAAPVPMRVSSAEIQRLKELAKKCGITIPPACYKGQPDSDELESRIGTFLTGPGGNLSSLRPSKCEIAKVKADRQLKMELDGIDTTNIVKGRRGSSLSESSFSMKRRVPASDDDDSDF